MNNDPPAKAILSSVKNAMRILRLFKKGQEELSVTEITRLIDLPKSTTHRLITGLVDEGFLSKNPKTNHYRLGLSLLTLGGVVFSHRDLYLEAQPIVDNLVDELGETAHICLLEDHEVVYLFRKECDQPERLLTYMGRKNPIHCTSEGLAIMAFQKQKRINSFLKNTFYSYTEFTLTDPKELRDEMSKIRKKGYAITPDHFYKGFVGIAAPIYDHTENVVASVSIISSTSRLSEERYPLFIDKIKAASSQISEMLGYFK
ncbi:IclR family transcriptional regulator [Metabacillus endolithicus]|uniref:IclR family transcriptional regulator n=1 Tax=Metabacillus endolithicus TaxID=1535204 RepID=A0ABW5C3Q4_9BACI|nr:IclR family transcriptional regulator [Metabacillus endolithicus]UPG62654.1 IclR family transcriptional regulator [Metabacillus endolithicus]